MPKAGRRPYEVTRHRLRGALQHDSLSDSGRPTGHPKNNTNSGGNYS